MSSTSKRAEFKAEPISVTVELLPSQISAIDGWRRQQEGQPSRAEAIARLVSQALSTSGAH